MPAATGTGIGVEFYSEWTEEGNDCCVAYVMIVEADSNCWTHFRYRCSLPLALTFLSSFFNKPPLSHFPVHRMSVQNLNSYGMYFALRLQGLVLSICNGKADVTIADPFADEGGHLAATANVGSTSEYIHIRIQQRNGRKTLTTLQGLGKGSPFQSSPH